MRLLASVVASRTGNYGQFFLRFCGKHLCIITLCLCKNCRHIFAFRAGPAGCCPRLASSAGDPLRSRHPPRRELWYHYFMAYIRKFKTTSGATGVQVCYKEGNRVVKTIHLGSASSEKSLARLVREAQGIIDQEKGKPLFNLRRFEKKD